MPSVGTRFILGLLGVVLGSRLVQKFVKRHALIQRGVNDGCATANFRCVCKRIALEFQKVMHLLEPIVE